MEESHSNNFANQIADVSATNQSLPEYKVNGNTRTARATLAQVLAVNAFGLLLLGIGLMLTMPTIVIGHLLNNKNESFQVDEYSASWLGSLLFMTQPLGSISSGFLQEAFGRRRCMMLVNIPQLIGWLIIYFSTSVNHLYIASIILGLTIGWMEAPVLSYVGEVTQPSLRGVLSSYSETFGTVGMLLECLFGALTDWRNTCAISAIVPVTAFVFIYMIPDSPTWLILQGRISEAEQALCWLRGWVDPIDVQEEFLTMVEYTNASHNVQTEIAIPRSTEDKATNYQKQANKPQKNLGLMDTLSLFTQPKIYRPLRMVLLISFISHCTSLLVIRPFLVNIFNVIGMPLNSRWVLVISGSIQIVGSFAGMYFMRLLGKRKVIFMSVSVCIICSYSLAISLMMKAVIPWIQFGLFCTSFFASGFGIMTFPYVLISEVFPIQGRGLASGLAAGISYFLAFLLTKNFINFTKWFDLHGTLFLYGTIAIFGIIYMYFYLPETEDRTLEEIEEYFQDKKNVKK